MLKINNQKYYSQSEVRKIVAYITKQNFISMIYRQYNYKNYSNMIVNGQCFFNNLSILRYIKNNSYRINEDKFLLNHYKSIDDGILQLIENARIYNDFKYNKIY